MPFDSTQGGELVEPFVICVLLFVIWSCNNHYKSGPVRFLEYEHEYEEEYEEEYEIAIMLLVVLVVVLVLVLGFSSN